MNYRIISLPSFLGVTSGVDKLGDFAEGGILMNFSNFFSEITPKAEESFMPRDFLYYDEENKGMTWIWALTESGETGGFETIRFEGGLYITFVCRDGDSAEHGELYKEVTAYIEDSDVFELDIRPGHYSMGHIITPPIVKEAQGWEQMEVYVPIRLKK